MLDPGGFRLRITNAGIIGNAFYNVGLSNDPSFEFPAYSGHECLNHAELWVGAVDNLGRAQVSGGPMLEWRPTLDPDDHVRIVHAGDPGTRRFVDDDGDGLIDEETLNGKDDDGDGRIDEDIAIIGQAMAAADYVDDRPEAVNYVYSTGETHVPLGLSVHQEAYGWAMAGITGLAGIHFTITNHGDQTLRGVLIGMLADLDSRSLTDPVGYLNDRIVPEVYSQSFNDGSASTVVEGSVASVACVTTLRDTVPVLVDGVSGSGLPAVAVIGLGHTTDGLATLQDGQFQQYARAPGKVSFRYTVFSNTRPPGSGGVPTLDQGRYDAMAGRDDGSPTDNADDYQVLVSCGPFNFLSPGQSLSFDVAFVAAQDLDSLQAESQAALYLYRGYKFNFLPDSTGPGARNYDVGRSGLNGHESCIEPPAGVSFSADAACAEKFPDAGARQEIESYSHGHCVWSDADCDLCTGSNGNETIEPWLDPGTLPQPPNFAITPGDHRVTFAWDNLPEIQINAGLIGTPRSNFVGYRVYKLGDWRNREGLLPPLQNWALVSAYGPNHENSETLLSSVTDTTLDYDLIMYEQKHYPIGRYKDVDTTAMNGFDYLYVVSTVMDFSYVDRNGIPALRRVESPIVSSFDERVVPHAGATAKGEKVWVVPNPFRATAPWDRPVVPGDPLTRHIDFMGLPKARSTIRIYTVAGDFVVKIDHDGTGGDGQAAWDLISRNGQDVVSGIYLFTVESTFGKQIGHFVVIR